MQKKKYDLRMNSSLERFSLVSDEQGVGGRAEGIPVFTDTLDTCSLGLPTCAHTWAQAGGLVSGSLVLAFTGPQPALWCSLTSHPLISGHI